MQCSILTRQLHRTACKEGRLPVTLYIGADNTPKETKNTTNIVWGIWLLSTLRGTSLREIQWEYPLVGHTHGTLDRFFSRLICSLRGRTYYTLSEMSDVTKQNLKGFNLNWSHHGSSYDWTYLRTVYGIEFHRYRNVHCVSLFVDHMGLWVKWKQFVSDQHWSTPRMVIEHDRLAMFATAKPPLVEHQFSEEAKAKHVNFLDKLETWQQLIES